MKKYLLTVLAIFVVAVVYWMYSDFIFGQGVEMRNANVVIRGGSPTFNQYNGSATVGATDYEYYTQALGGVDDYNDGQAAYPTGSYQGSWTDCTAGNNYCGTGDSTYADAKDNNTGLIWSVVIEDTGDYTQDWFWANNCYEPGTTENPGACGSDDDVACQCVKLPTGSKTGCEALGNGWRLPYQKELIQAYIDGSNANLSNLDYNYDYRSATTVSWGTDEAWIVGLTGGWVYDDSKTNNTSYKVVCVRQ
jgi:hypothetical protein